MEYSSLNLQGEATKMTMQRPKPTSHNRCCDPSKGVRNAVFYFLLGFTTTIMIMRQLSIIRLNYNQVTTSIASSASINLIADSVSQQRTSSVQAGVESDVTTNTDSILPPKTSSISTIQADADVLQQATDPIQENKEEIDLVPDSLEQSSPSIQDDVVESNQTTIQTLLEKYQYHPPEPRTLMEIEQTASATCGTFNNSFQSFWSLDSKQRSRLDEDKKIFEKFFRHIQDYSLIQSEDFHYVELGAFDGMGESNTRFFDVCLGWTGLLIEPNPKVYTKLVVNRPYAHRVSYAASCNDTEDNNQTVTFYASAFTNAAEDNSPNREAYVGSDLATEVPCGGLHPVLINVFPSQRIHFFSLDTEGVEYSILQTIDFNDIFIDVFIIENWNQFCKESCPGRDNVRAFMQSKGYKRYDKTIQYSDLYVHPESEFATQSE